MTIDKKNAPEVYAVAVPSADPDMKQAYQEARDTLATFIASVQNPAATQSYFAVKLKLCNDAGEDEYVWLRDVSFDDQAFTGELSSTPGQSYKLNTRYQVERNDIYDWMIVDNGNLVGGYTIRVARHKMSVEDRRQFDERLWFNVD
jgi:uncharacterized protein YegJ (DUF2314 family)